MLLRRFHPGWAVTSAMVAPYAQHWAAGNEAAMAGNGPLLVALGDSTAQGIGASAPDHGFVGGLATWLGQRSPGGRWRVVNLSRSGARAADVLALQVPAMEDVVRVAAAPSLVTLAVGANDMVRRTPLPAIRTCLEATFSLLPSNSVVATLPQGLGRRRPLLVNDLIRELAATAGLRVADVWAHTGPPWRGKFAADGFHPNDAGYRDWLAAFTTVVGDISAVD